jgi:hypothetical protein
VLRRFGLIVLIVVPAVAAPWASAKLADRFGQRFGAALAKTFGGSWLFPAAVETPHAEKQPPSEAMPPVARVPGAQPAVISQNNSDCY